MVFEHLSASRTSPFEVYGRVVTTPADQVGVYDRGEKPEGWAQYSTSELYDVFAWHIDIGMQQAPVQHGGHGPSKRRRVCDGEHRSRTVEELCIGPGGEETWKKRNDKQATWF